MHTPELSKRECAGVVVWVDEHLLARMGILVGFSERTGGVSRPPFASLNLSAEQGDEPVDVDENRSRLLEAVGLERVRGSLTLADQVHGDRIEVIDERSVGSGAYDAGKRAPVPSTDALVTSLSDVPLMVLVADCVPVVLVSAGRTPAIAVVHAGWRGALAGIARRAAIVLAEHSGITPAEVLGYIGPHIGPCHYSVDAERLSRFMDVFGKIARADGGLDLGAVVLRDLVRAGVPERNVFRTHDRTAHDTGRFFSYRAEGVTGRQAALAAVVAGM